MQESLQNKIQGEKLKSIPVKVNFGKTKNQEFKDYYIETHSSPEEVEIKLNYFREEYFSKFHKSNHLILNSNSNLKIEINAYPGKKFWRGEWSHLFAFFSLYIIPIKDHTNGKVHFDIYDIKNNSKLKSYTYDIEHRIYTSWASIPVAGVILPMFSERFDHSTNLKTYAIARVVYNEFEADFTRDFNTDETLQKATYLNNPPVYKIQNPTKEEIGKNPYLPYLIARLESKLLQQGIEIIKQDDSPKSPSSMKTDKVIKVDSLSILKDSVNVNVSCLDIKDEKKEIWTEKISLPMTGDNTESNLNLAVDRLVENLVSKREIN